MTPDELWAFLPIGYAVTVAIELPILLLTLHPRHPIRRRILAGLWLTACTYPVVILVLPNLFDTNSERTLYLVVAETFAPAAEWALFLIAFGAQSKWRDGLAIVAANVASFLLGSWVCDFLI